MSNQTMTPEEADHFISILKRPRMYLGDSVTFSQIVGFIIGLRYAKTSSHNFGFGTFPDLVREHLNALGDSRGWWEIIEDETSELELADACEKLSQLLAEWTTKERDTSATE